MFSTAEEELAHSSIVLRIPHNRYGALADVAPFRHLNQRVFTVSPLPNYQSEEEQQLTLHVPVSPTETIPAPLTRAPSASEQLVAPPLAAPVAPTVAASPSASQPPVIPDPSARRPRNWREWRRDHVPSTAAPVPAPVSNTDTKQSETKAV